MNTQPDTTGRVKAMANNSATGQLSQIRLIAPCGMNCGLCRAFLRSRNRCPGCRGEDRGKPKTRVLCRIKKCPARRRVDRDSCANCASFPCERLRRLDQRYRLKYGMSMIENLLSIKADGLRNFVEREKSKWACPRCGETLCVHEEFCLVCQRRWRKTLPDKPLQSSTAAPAQSD